MAQGLKNIHTILNYSLVEKKKGNFWKVHSLGTMEPSVSPHCDGCGSVNSSDSSTGRMIAPVVSPEIIRLAIFFVVSTVSNSVRSREERKEEFGFTAILDPRHLVSRLRPPSRIPSRVSRPRDCRTLREELSDKKKIDRQSEQRELRILPRGTMTILPVLLGTLGALIAAQDTKTMVFPPNGNGTSLEMGGKMEPATYQPDMTRTAVPTTLVVPPQPQPMLPSDYFFPSKDFSILVTLRRCRV